MHKHETTTDIFTIDPTTGETIGCMGSRQKIVMSESKPFVGVIYNDGRMVYRNPNGVGWIYEPAGYAILSRNYPAIAPVVPS